MTGWTAERQIAFIEALAETACVEEACRRVGTSDSYIIVYHIGRFSSSVPLCYS